MSIRRDKAFNCIITFNEFLQHFCVLYIIQLHIIADYLISWHATKFGCANRKHRALRLMGEQLTLLAPSRKSIAWHFDSYNGKQCKLHIHVSIVIVFAKVERLNKQELFYRSSSFVRHLSRSCAFALLCNT